MKIIMTNPEKGYEVLCLVRDDHTVMVSHESLCDGLRANNGVDYPVGYKVTSCQAYLCKEGTLWIDPNCMVLKDEPKDCPLESGLDLERQYGQWADNAVKILKERLNTPKSYLNMRVILQYFKEPIEISDDWMWNATNMSVRCGKKVSDWLDEKRTSRTLHAFMNRYRMPQDKLVKIVCGGGNRHAPGLWLSDRLMPEFFSWLSADFSVLFDDAITDMLQKAGMNTNATEISTLSFTTSK